MIKRALIVFVATLCLIPVIVTANSDLIVKVTHTEMKVISESLDIFINIENKTGSRIRIKKIKAIFPDEFKNRDFVYDNKEIEINTNDTGVIYLKIDKIPFKNIFKEWLFFLSAKYPIKIIGEYEIAIDATTRLKKIINEQLVLQPLGTIWGVTTGGLAGVLSAFLFNLLLFVSQNKTDPFSVKKELTNLFMGLIVVTIVIILFRYSSVDLPVLPISVNVKDLIGGFVIGLFYKPLVNWFQKLIQIAGIAQ